MYIPIHVHTTWSLLDSALDIEDLADKAKEFGFKAVCLTDHMNVKGVVAFQKAMLRRDIKPVIGVELDVYIENKDITTRLTVLAKNKIGYKEIVKLISKANYRSQKEDKLHVTIEDLKKHRRGLICLIGDIQSEISHVMFTDWKGAYLSNSIEMCETYLNPNWKEDVKECLDKYKNLFENVFLYSDYSSLPILKIMFDCMSKNDLGLTWLPSNNIHYLNEEDNIIHNLILESWADVHKKAEDIKDLNDNRIFLTEKPYCHMIKPNTDRYNLEFLKLYDLIEDFSVQAQPILPSYKADAVKETADEILHKICQQGFAENGLVEELKKDEELRGVYINRIKEELRIFSEANISGYFLVVHDLINFARICNIPVDIRGSATGCMVSFLAGFSSVDPLRPDPTLNYDETRELPLFRFYNEGRNTKDNISLPDIDIDIPTDFRGTLIDYARKKYGKDCVGHIITHSRFKGKGAIKEVFKLTKPVSNYFEVANDITKSMTDESKISDELAEIRKDNSDYGIIQWNIDNVVAIAQAYATYKKEFDLAIKLEKVPKNEGVHAAGIIIADQSLDNLFPMRYNENLDELVVDIEGTDIEFLGGVKFDILGVAALEKVYQIMQMVNYKKEECVFGIDRDFSGILHEATK